MSTNSNSFPPKAPLDLKAATLRAEAECVPSTARAFSSSVRCTALTLDHTRRKFEATAAAKQTLGDHSGWVTDNAQAAAKRLELATHTGAAEAERTGWSDKFRGWSAHAGALMSDWRERLHEGAVNLEGKMGFGAPANAPNAPSNAAGQPTQEPPASVGGTAAGGPPGARLS